MVYFADGAILVFSAVAMLCSVLIYSMFCLFTWISFILVLQSVFLSLSMGNVDRHSITNEEWTSSFALIVSLSPFIAYCSMFSGSISWNCFPILWRRVKPVRDKYLRPLLNHPTEILRIEIEFRENLPAPWMNEPWNGFLIQFCDRAIFCVKRCLAF